MLEDLVRLAAGAASTTLALLFLRAALHKASDVAAFEGVLANYGAGRVGLAAPAARVLPALEGLCALMLLVPSTAQFGAALAIALLALYAGAMAFNLVQGRRLLDCGCGGAPLALSWGLVTRNAALAAAAVPSALGLGWPQGWGDALVMTAVGALAWLALTMVEKLASNHARMRKDRRSGLWAFGPGAFHGSAAE